jgi:hypothetical protein
VYLFAGRKVLEEQAERKRRINKKGKKVLCFHNSKYLIFSTVSTVPNLEKNI